jgi:glutamate/aspartate transport system substrate-binding protein
VRTAVKANSGIKSVADLNGKTVATTTGTTSVQTLRKNEARQGHRLQGGLRQGPRRQLPAARIRPRRRLRDGRFNILAGNIATAKNPADYKIVGEC